MKIAGSLFFRTFAVTALVLLIFVFAGFAVNGLWMRPWGESARLHPPMPKGPFRGTMSFKPGLPPEGGMPPDSGPPPGMEAPPGPPDMPGPFPSHPSVITARILGAASPADRDNVLAEFLRIDSRSGARYVLLDASGHVLYPKEQAPPFHWGSIPVPTEPYGFTPIDPSTPFPARTLIRLGGRPLQYLYVELKPPGRIPARVPLFMFGSHVLAVLLGAWVSLMILFRSLRRNLEKVDRVMMELQHGNLKARIPVSGNDEIDGTMVRFNRMTGEIERLVEHLRDVESSRMKLLQELAHDLRTPIASLRNLVETVQKKDESMDRSLRAELLGLAGQEIMYFERLVEDLLVLAQINEPSYRTSGREIRLDEIVLEVADAAGPQGAIDGRAIQLRKTNFEGDLRIQGDAHLLKRMIRNTLDNAYAFARSEVKISMERVGSGRILIGIEDDGPGFSPDALASFGERRPGRTWDQSKRGGLRAGLGTVIMKDIAHIHGGVVRAANRTGPSGEVLGARVEIELPGSSGDPDLKVL